MEQLSLKQHVLQIWGKTFFQIWYMKNIHGTKTQFIWGIAWLILIPIAIISEEFDISWLYQISYYGLVYPGAVLVICVFWGAYDMIRIGYWMRKIYKIYPNKSRSFLKKEVELIIKQNHIMSFIEFLFRKRIVFLGIWTVLQAIGLILHFVDKKEHYLTEDYVSYVFWFCLAWGLVGLGWGIMTYRRYVFLKSKGYLEYDENGL